METNQFISKVIGVVVVLLVITSVAVPTLSNLSLGDTHINETTGLRYSQGGDHTIEVSSGVTIDGQAIPNSDGPRIFAFGPDFMVVEEYGNVQINRGSILEFEVLSSSNPGTIHITENRFTITIDGSNKYFEFKGIAYFADPTGESNLGLMPTMTNLDDFQVVVKSGTEIIVLYQPYESSGYATVIGTEAEVVSMSINRPGFAGGVKEMGVGLSYSESEGLATYGPGKVTVTIGSQSRMGGGYVIAPVEFETISDEQEIFNSVVAAIPLIMVVGILLAAVGAFLYRRLS